MNFGYIKHPNLVLEFTTFIKSENKYNGYTVYSSDSGVENEWTITLELKTRRLNAFPGVFGSFFKNGWNFH